MHNAPTITSDPLQHAERHTLPNGMRVVILTTRHAPTISIYGDIGRGAVDEPAERAGLALFTGSALTRGTAQRSYQQIVQQTEELASNVSTWSGQHQSNFSARCLREDLPTVLAILADVLRHPTFPPEEIEQLRAQYLMYLRESDDEPQDQAIRAMCRLLYPADHPYSRLTVGTSETIQRITRDDLLAFHQQYHPAATILTLVGDVDSDTALALLGAVFGDWHPATPPPPAAPLPPVPPLTAPQHETIALAGKTQTDLVWATHGIARTDPDYYAVLVANVILGQSGMGGRLSDVLRQDKGLVYSAGSGISADVAAGPWYAYASVNPPDVPAAVAALQHEIAHFAADGPTEQELADVQAYLTGSMVLGLEGNMGLASVLLGIERHGLGADFISRYPAIINALTHDEVTAAARRYLNTAAYVLVAAGPEGVTL